MKRSIGIAAALMITLSASLAAAGGVTISHAQNEKGELNLRKLTNAGWLCFIPGGFVEVHCASPGAMIADETFPFMVFDTTDPTDENAVLLGAEHIIRADLYRGQPCAANQGDVYEPLDFTGDGVADYYACHLYDVEHHD